MGVGREKRRRERDRKKEKDDPNYDTQKFTRADGTEGERAGACYADLTGMIKKIEFRTHQEYGENHHHLLQIHNQKIFWPLQTEGG